MVRNGETGRELVGLTWGMPSPQFVTQGKPDTGVTNIRNVTSPHWRGWLQPESRCVVPWTTFCEWEDTKPRKIKRWFALNEEAPLAFFAGVWTDWHGVRGSMKNPRDGKKRKRFSGRCLMMVWCCCLSGSRKSKVRYY